MKYVIFSLFCFCLQSLIAQEEQHLQGSTALFGNNHVLQASNTVQASVLEVTVFPNPSNGKLTIEGKEGSTVTVYSASGVYVGTWMISAEGKVSLEDLTTGSYVCSVELLGTRCMKRFVVL